MLQFYSDFTAWLNSEEGQGMAEYALIIALIAVLLIGALQLVQGGIEGAFTDIVNGLSGTNP